MTKDDAMKFQPKTLMGYRENLEVAEKLLNQQGLCVTEADKRQVGGDHYKEMGVQPWAVMEALLSREEFIGFLKGNIIKYAMRVGKKESDDVGKCLHYMQKLKEVEAQG